MLHKILELDGTQPLSTNEQKSLIGGGSRICSSTCGNTGGVLLGNGQCACY